MADAKPIRIGEIEGWEALLIDALLPHLCPSLDSEPAMPSAGPRPHQVGFDQHV